MSARAAPPPVALEQPSRRRAGWWFVPAANVKGRANYIFWSGFDRLDWIGVALK